jgi:hypothetical protein
MWVDVFLASISPEFDHSSHNPCPSRPAAPFTTTVPRQPGRAPFKPSEVPSNVLVIPHHHQPVPATNIKELSHLPQSLTLRIELALVKNNSTLSAHPSIN